MNKILLGAIVVVAAIAVGAYFFPQMKFLGASSVGSTFNSAKIAAIQFTPSAAGATTTSILNSDGTDRFITDAFVVCQNATTSYTAVTGAGLSSLNFKAATTTTSAPNSVTNTNLVMNLNIATGTVAAGVASDYGGVVFAATSTLATTSPAGFIAAPSSGNAAANAFKSVWAASSYLTFVSNATNTAACTVGVHYFGS